MSMIFLHPSHIYKVHDDGRSEEKEQEQTDGEGMDDWARVPAAGNKAIDSSLARGVL